MQGESSTKKEKLYAESFREEWLQDPELKNWLQQDKNDKEASYCNYCNVTLKSANKSILLQHKSSVKHKICFDVAKSSVVITVPNDITRLTEEDNRRMMG
ncbi:hypothetical protein SK128_002862 [Halocaridina rubra]|uniref:Uncharacterized protein n=1 Tax=Halocaridina rubra TaxID=373956 RepID=A0AAN9A4Q8_HALRR